LYHDLAGVPALTANISGTIHANVSPAPDPLRALAPPNPADYAEQVSSSGVGSGLLGPLGNLLGGLNLTSGSTTLQPGVYYGGINISGNASITLAPGVYLLNGGGFLVSGNASISGDGVLLYNTGGASAGSINISTSASVRLTPPPSGPYQGISIFQDRGLGNLLSHSASGSVQITGTVYGAGASIQLSGNGGAAGSTMGGAYIANNIQVSGGGNFTISHGTNRPRVPDIGLVE
jgi:hypothetical protein